METNRLLRCQVLSALGAKTLYSLEKLVEWKLGVWALTGSKPIPHKRAALYSLEKLVEWKLHAALQRGIPSELSIH
jgi:hypothetical protein